MSYVKAVKLPLDTFTKLYKRVVQNSAKTGKLHIVWARLLNTKALKYIKIMSRSLIEVAHSRVRVRGLRQHPGTSGLCFSNWFSMGLKFLKVLQSLSHFLRLNLRLLKKIW